MYRTQIIGAIRFPAFLLLWSAGLVLFVSQLHPADAAIMRSVPVGEAGVPFDAPLSAVPSMADKNALEASLEAALDAGDLAAGWQPAQQATKSVADARTPIVYVEEIVRVIEQELPGATVDSAPGHDAPPMKTPVAKTAVVEAIQPPALDVIAETKRAARMVLRSSHPADAYALLIRSVKEARDDAEYLGLLAVAALQRQLFSEAEVVYRKLVEMEPGNDRWSAGLMLAQERLGLSPDYSYKKFAKRAADNLPMRPT